jgi:hypothetical protein
MSVTTVHNKTGLYEMFQKIEGRKFMGAVDGGDCIELVFEEKKGLDGEGLKGDQNMITLFQDGRVALGFVSDCYPDLVNKGIRR